MEKNNNLLENMKNSELPTNIIEGDFVEGNIIEKKTTRKKSSKEPKVLEKIEVLSKSKTVSKSKTTSNPRVVKGTVANPTKVTNKSKTTRASKTPSQISLSPKTTVPSNVKNSRKKILSKNKRLGDKNWEEVNVREEKKALKLAKKANFREIHLNELVNDILVPCESTTNKQDLQECVENELSALASSAKKILATEKNTKNIKKTEKNIAKNVDIVKNTIVDSIAQIIDSAEKKIRKDKETALVRKKIKRLLNQENKKILETYVATSEVYPLHTPPSIQLSGMHESDMHSAMHEHTLYPHIMEHGLNVSNYARMLFLGLEPLHTLSDIWFRRLLLAAQYHDIGTIDGAKAHHKSGYVRMRSDFGILISDEDREMVALLVRYHRRAMPSQEHEEFAKLSLEEQEELCKVASILRVADALDYGHQGAIEKVDVHINKKDVVLVCHSQKNISQERSRVSKKGDLFERTYKKRLECKPA